jgi:histidine triad (HIT) family protein
MAEDQAALEEQLKNMPPEELREFQKKQCIFCHIVEGKVQSRRLYEDEDCLAFLDINPATQGHILLIPKEHYQIMPLMPDQLVGKLFKVAKGLSNALLKGMKAEGTHIFVANGMAAGQKAQHFMLHVIPRMANDGFGFSLPQKQMTPQDMKVVHERVTTRLNEMMGIKPQAEKEEKSEEKKPEDKEESKDEAQSMPVPEKKESKAPKELDLDSIANLLKNG